MMASDLETSFKELTGSPIKKGFAPHLTILKLSKDFKLRRKVQYAVINFLLMCWEECLKCNSVDILIY
jgi:hypothetical protein